MIRRRAVLGSVVLLCLILSLAGCGAPKPAPWTGIEGYVTAGLGDGAVAGAKVNLYHVTAENPNTYIPSAWAAVGTTTTGSNGYYRFSGLAVGATYMVVVNPTAAYAGARYQHLVIRQANEHVRADLFTKPKAPATSDPGMPYITSILSTGGLMDGQIVAAPQELTVTVEPAADGAPIKQFFCRVGHYSNGSDQYRNNGETYLTFTLDPKQYRNGDSFILVTAYDLNDNTATVRVPIGIDNGLPVGTVQPPAIVRVEAWTFGELSDYRAADRRLPAKMPRWFTIGGRKYPMPDFSSLNDAAAARAIGAGCSSLVHLQIGPQPDPSAKGYRIYRSTSPDGPFALIGERANLAKWYETASSIWGLGEYDMLWFNDLDPALTPSGHYYYRVTAVGLDGQESAPHEKTFHVQIVPKFTVNLQSPMYGASVNLNTTSAPNFTWSQSGGLGRLDLTGFVIYTMNRNDENYSWLHIADGTTSSRYGDYYVDDANLSMIFGVPYPTPPLIPNALYEWDLLLAVSGATFDWDYGFNESYAAFFSWPKLDYRSSNGAFSFTTVN